MIKNYIKIALRHIRSNFLYSFINMLGLSIGVASSVLMIIFGLYELSYDQYHSKKDRIYRIGVEAVIGNTNIHQLGTPPPLAEALYMEIPEIDKVCRILDLNEVRINYENENFTTENCCAVDSTFFQLFDCEFIEGSPHKALARPNTGVISETAKRQIFGEAKAVGKTIHINNQFHIEIVGVMKNMPHNSHLQIDYLVSANSIVGYFDDDNWFNNGFVSYMLFKDNINEPDIEKKLNDLIKKYHFSNMDYDEWAADGNKWEYYLQSLPEIHLNSHLSQELSENGNKNYVRLFFILSFVVILIACINFMNLTTAKSAGRAKEVGLRKVLGAHRKSLVWQFLGESVVMSFFAVCIGMVIVESILPAYRNLLQKPLSIHYFDNFYVLPALLILALIIGVFSGSYPAFYLSRFSPGKVLHSKLLKGAKSSVFRNILVVFQFAITISLLICTGVVFKQLKYLNNKNLGFLKDQVIVLNNLGAMGNQRNAFRDELINLACVDNASLASVIPGTRHNNVGFQAEEVESGFTMNLAIVDRNYADVLGLNISQGRFFNGSIADSLAVVVNEEAVRLLGYENPLQMHVFCNWLDPAPPLKIVGVVEDYFYHSRHEKMFPLAILNLDGLVNWPGVYCVVKLSGSDFSASIKDIEKLWNKMANNVPFHFDFLDDHYNQLYQNEEEARKLLMIFTLLSIFIASLGLFGLSSYMAEQKTKEIGIRKVMGASRFYIIKKLSFDFTRWVLFSNIIAWPLAWFLMNSWLNTFAYKTNVSVDVMLGASLIALFIALFTVSYQSLKSASANPVDSLRYE